MAVLPYSRVVNVTLTRQDAFPTRRGFGVPLFLSTVAVAGEVDASNLIKVYGSIDEVAVDWVTTTDTYKAAVQAFSQNPRPVQIKVAYINPTGLNEAGLEAALDAIYAVDNQWYWLCIDSVMRDQAYLDGIVDWVQAKNKIAILDSNDTDLEDPDDTANIAARHVGTVDRTAVFYSTTASDFPAFALAAKLGTFNFDDADSAYTAKFKALAGITPLNKGSAVVQAITGFTPQIGQADSTGHLANCYIDIGGRDFVVEGSVLTANVFIDEIHATDWIIARTEEEALGILLNAKRVPFTDAGMEQLASAARTVMRLATRAGLVALDLNPQTGEYEPAVQVTVPSVFDVTAAQRKTRVAPAIAVRFRYSGAVHYTTINYTMAF